MSLGCHIANLTLESAPAFLTSRHEIVKLPACRRDWEIEDTMQYHTCVAMGTSVCGMTERELRAQLGLLDHARVGDKLSCRSIEEYQAGSITGKLCRVFIKEQPFRSSGQADHGTKNEGG